MTYFIEAWFYILMGVAYGPFDTRASCQETRTYHTRQVEQPAWPCELAYYEQGRA